MDSTNQPGPNQTPIYVDPVGRRRRADGDVAKFPKVEDDPSKAAAAENAALRAELAAYKAQNDARTITGSGFSGTLGNGLSWNPFGAGALGPASQDPSDGGGGYDPTFPTNPYPLGTNSTSGGGAVANNDNWTLAAGPSPSGGGPWDGFFGSLTRIWPLGVGNGFIIFTRTPIGNDAGIVVEISAESGELITGI